jgi:hypothetical protein
MVVSLLVLGPDRRSRGPDRRSRGSGRAVMSELLELCGGMVVPPSIEEVRTGSHEISVVANSLSQALGFEKSGHINAAVYLSHESGMHVVSFGVGLLSLVCWQHCSELSSQRGLRFFCRLGCCLSSIAVG